MAALARENSLHVRFIEMMPIGLGKEFTARGEEQIKAVLEKEYGLMTPTEEKLGNGPCHYYTLEEFTGRIGFISALSHKFCDSCNRVRLTSTGFLKGCLQFEDGADLKVLLRSGCSDGILKETIEKVIYEKPVGTIFRNIRRETKNPTSWLKSVDDFEKQKKTRFRKVGFVVVSFVQLKQSGFLYISV